MKYNKTQPAPSAPFASYKYPTPLTTKWPEATPMTTIYSKWRAGCL